MARVKLGFKACILCSQFILLVVFSKSIAAEIDTTEVFKNANGTDNNENSEIKVPSAESSTTLSPLTSTLSALASAPESSAAISLSEAQIAEARAFLAAHKSDVAPPPTIPDFIRKMMLRFGEAKAAEAFRSLDQLPLGLVMKILLVEMDTDLAADIVAMQRYAQSSDKALITMIGRIVAGDKNVPKEIISMDLKLMNFSWWMRIRERMLSNLEKYISAYSLVPVVSNTPSKSIRGLETSSVDEINSDLTAAVAASATESSNKIVQQVASAVAPSNNAGQNVDLESLKTSLLNPLLQQQQLLGALALSKAAAASSAQAQNLLQQTQQATNFNPSSLLGLLG